MKKILVLLSFCVLLAVMTACVSSPLLENGEDTSRKEDPTVSGETTAPTDENSAASDEDTEAPENETQPHVHSFGDPFSGGLCGILPTCTEDGYGHTHCSCGAPGEDVVLPATGHSFSDWKSEEPLSACADRVEKRICGECGLEETNIIRGEVSHDYDSRNECVECGTRIVATEGLLYRYSEKYEGYEVCGSEGTLPEDVVIAPYYDRDPVVGIVSLGESAAVKSIFIPDTVIGISAIFSSSLEAVYIENLEAWCAMKCDHEILKNAGLYVRGELLTDLVIPEGMETITRGAFAGYTRLTSITIPDSLKKIPQYAFDGCEKLCEVYVPSLSKWLEIEGASSVFDREWDLYVDGKLLTDLVIADYSIPNVNNTFSKCRSLTSVKIISETRTALPDDIFSGCSNLVRFEMICSDAEKNQLQIGQAAFKDCVKLSEVILPDSVTSIGNCAFMGCTSLTEIDLPTGLESIGESAFEGAGLRSIRIPEGIVSIYRKTFYHCYALENIVLPKELINIASGAFTGSKITSIVLPKSLWDIGDYAFDECSSLETIFYCCTKEEGLQYTKGHHDDKCFSSATFCYYSAEEPAEEGNYWRFVDGVPTKW